jgi:hypothetical protein
MNNIVFGEMGGNLIAVRPNGGEIGHRGLEGPLICKVYVLYELPGKIAIRVPKNKVPW